MTSDSELASPKETTKLTSPLPKVSVIDPLSAKMERQGVQIHENIIIPGPETYHDTQATKRTAFLTLYGQGEIRCHGRRRRWTKRGA